MVDMVAPIATGPWQYFTPAEGIWYQWRLNGSRVFLRRSSEHWQHAAQPKTRAGLDGVFDGPLPVDEPMGLEKSVSVAAMAAIALRPTMTNKPIVIEAINSLRISRGHEAQFTLDLPVSVHFEFESGELLARLNTFQLNQTWFGDTTSGVLCFAWPLVLLPSSLAESPAGPTDFGSMLRCQIIVRNLSKVTLEVKQFAVYTEMLNIWETDGRLVTDTVLLEGLSDGSLRMGIIPDKKSRSGTWLHPAVVGQTDLLIKRGVSFLKSITGITRTEG